MILLHEKMLLGNFCTEILYSENTQKWQKPSLTWLLEADSIDFFLPEYLWDWKNNYQYYHFWMRERLKSFSFHLHLAVTCIK